jgi:hypothetical protein
MGEGKTPARRHRSDIGQEMSGLSSREVSMDGRKYMAAEAARTPSTGASSGESRVRMSERSGVRMEMIIWRIIAVTRRALTRTSMVKRMYRCEVER